MTEAVDGDDLLRFVGGAPSPFHAVATIVARLEQAGFRRLDERDRWELAPGDRRYVARDGGSIAALVVGTAPPSSAGAVLVGAHTDSPTLKVRPRPDIRRAGYRLVGVEPYGGLLLHTWLDRELTLAGRVAVRTADGGVETRLVVLPGAPLRIPSLAIHLDRSIREQGLRIDPQRHAVPLWGPDVDGAEPGLVAAVAAVLDVPAGDVVGHDLVAADTQPPARTGADGAWLAAPRLDNLASCHAGSAALVASAPTPAAHTRVFVANDHEEVGSGSAEGARGSFLEDVLRRMVAATGETDPQAWPRTAARSRLASTDVAHAVHPNHEERHEPSHRPAFGGGPVLKVNANQSYATDAGSGGWFTARCADAGVPLQHFVSRADLPCGSTIGPLTAARLGISTVDVGAPVLGMHSCRELAASADVPLVARALEACLTLG